ncbi:MAG: hypothetical protein EPN82_16915 [Bacteroidetes bacterium]|nr:MAG: hypothetical protein EPN82_16915 [Bacteroidota bacterium]
MANFKNYIIVLCLFLCIQQLYSEKPFIDSNGKVTVKHIFLKLDAKQVKQVSRCWAFELNDKQIKEIKKINGKVKVKVLDIITYPYYGISDNLFCYGIWNKPDSVALPIVFIKEYNEELSNYYDADPEYYNYLKKRTFDDVIKKLDSLTIYIDLSGKTYINNNEFSIEQIFRIIDNVSIYNKIPDNKFNTKSISVNTAPILNKAIEKTIKSKLQEIKNYTMEKDVDCWDKITVDIFK